MTNFMNCDPKKVYENLENALWTFCNGIEGPLQEEAKQKWETKDSKFELNTSGSCFSNLIKEYGKCMPEFDRLHEHQKGIFYKKATFYYNNSSIGKLGIFLASTSFDLKEKTYKLKIYAPKSYGNFSQDIKNFLKTGNFTDDLENLVKKEDDDFKMPRIMRTNDGKEQQFQNKGFCDIFAYRNPETSF
eukprot:GHVP01030320.1.p1 GENE.GHVP01030320.1~~GHVP01030320.1.p1  ORF type:complete len:212 (-),score=39.61 GHVP01030320.1:292-855(-)